jgi:uncharacterized protein (DUF2267 family)
VTSVSNLTRVAHYPSDQEGGGRSRPPPAHTLEAKVGQPEPAAATPLARLMGQTFTCAEFIATVQEVAALTTAEEAHAAAKVVLGELGGCLSWPTAQNLAARLPKPLRQVVRRGAFTGSMCGFSPSAFLNVVAEQERVDLKRAAKHTRAVLLALDRTLPKSLAEQLRSELASVWVRLTYLPMENRHRI